MSSLNHFSFLIVENNCHTNQGQCEDICVPNVDGSHTCLCQQNYQLVDDMCVEGESMYLSPSIYFKAKMSVQL